MKSAIIALIAMLSLTACTSAPSKPNALLLPDVPEYSRATQQAAAVEMEQSCDKMPTVCDTFMPDYKVMRDQTKSAKKILSK